MTLLDLFRRQVRDRPDAIAVESDAQILTYRELDEAADRVAHTLYGLKCVPGETIGLTVGHSATTIVALLGILKSGAPFLPLDPEHPPAWLGSMVREAKVTTVVITGEPRSWQDRISADFLTLDPAFHAISGAPTNDPGAEVSGRDVAAVFYTSGSTGRPKGVLQTHRALRHIAVSLRDAYDAGPQSRVLQFASLSWVSSIAEIGMALISGSTLCVGTRSQLLPGPPLADYLERKGITHAHLTPTALLALPEVSLPSLRVLSVGGESCPRALIERWSSTRMFVNCYGTTEIVGATLGPVEPGVQEVHVGRPLPGVRCQIVGPDLQLLPAGETGEILVGGPSVALGYVDRPELTKKCFLPDPLDTESGARRYRTGDRGFITPEGNLVVKGRMDRQVKIRGARVEMDEVEAVLRDHPEVIEAVVTSRTEESGSRLVAYLVPSTESLGVGSVRSFLGQRLPAVMIPSTFVWLDAIPRGVTQKVDWESLPVPTGIRPDVDQRFLLARTDLEAGLVGIWSEVLGLEDIGVLDDFAQLGGNSLQAMEIASRVIETWALAIGVDELLVAETVADMALRIEQLSEDSEQQSKREPSALVLLSPNRSGPPVFAVHDITGEVSAYRSLPEHVPGWTLYGLRNVKAFGDLGSLRSVEDTAARYVEAIRTVAPDGPFHLVGYSFGGIIAFEMARQLLAAGYSTPLLCVLDQEPPNTERSLRLGRNPFPVFARASIPATDLVRYLIGSILGRLRRVGGRSATSVGKPVVNFLQWPPQFRPVVEANARLFQAYRPEPISISILLIQAAKRSFRRRIQERLAWARLAIGEVQATVVPGTHDTMLAPQNAANVGQRILEALAAAP